MAQQSPSPAARPRPKPTSIETYPAAQVETGERRFVSQCGFCHGRDAAGDESGPDLTRSELVAADKDGDKIGPLLSAGRPDAGMPSFHIDDKELKAIAAFIHTQANKFADLGGGRRSVDPRGPGHRQCCGWPRLVQRSRRLRGMSFRYRRPGGRRDALSGIDVAQRMLYPSGQPAPAPPKATLHTCRPRPNDHCPAGGGG